MVHTRHIRNSLYILNFVSPTAELQGLMKGDIHIELAKELIEFFSTKDLTIASDLCCQTFAPVQTMIPILGRNRTGIRFVT
jgi:hypothetical protein